MDFLNLLIAAFFGIVEGITEWLPISSTGHMILLNEFVHLNVTKEFWDMFLVVIQLGAILAVVLLYWGKLFPFTVKEKKLAVKPGAISMWAKILVACIPAAVVGLLLDDWIDAHFYNYTTVSIALIFFGILYIIVENKNAKKVPQINDMSELSYKNALLIGLFQLIAAIFPGTSRSGATIVGGLMLGLSRTLAAEFTFFLAVPVMFGASLLKLVKFGLSFSASELAILAVGLIVAFVVSVLVIKFLMSYIKKHDFKVFGWYRIVLGILVLAYFLIF